VSITAPPNPAPQDREVRPFELHVPEEALDDLRDRLRRTRWPERETVSTDAGRSWRQGPPLAYVRELVESWLAYDWRRVESALNAHGQATTTIDGEQIHLLHVRSPRPDARPLVITHGWPSSVLEPLAVMDALANPADTDQPAFHVVAPSLPGFGFGSRPASTGWSAERTSDAWSELMTRLGYERFHAAGGDWGARVTAGLAVRHTERVAGVHSFTPYVSAPDDPEAYGPLSDQERSWLRDRGEFMDHGRGYSIEQSTRPQTIGYALTDSPAGLAAWIYTLFQDVTDSDGDPEKAVDRDRILDDIMLYWLPNAAASSARLYWEDRQNNAMSAGPMAPNPVPAGFSVFPAEAVQASRRWIERRFETVLHYAQLDRGGHFAALEQPGLLTEEIRTTFRPVRAA
jgi:epoxide hydrolase